jgi:hypothetical protein
MRKTNVRDNQYNLILPAESKAWKQEPIIRPEVAPCVVIQHGVVEPLVDGVQLGSDQDKQNGIPQDHVDVVHRQTGKRFTKYISGFYGIYVHVTIVNYCLRGRLHVYESVYDSLYDSRSTYFRRNKK